jgi:hypothetical protein
LAASDLLKMQQSHAHAGGFKPQTALEPVVAAKVAAQSVKILRDGIRKFMSVLPDRIVTKEGSNRRQLATIKESLEVLLPNLVPDAIDEAALRRRFETYEEFEAHKARQEAAEATRKAIHSDLAAGVNAGEALERELATAAQLQDFVRKAAQMVQEVVHRESLAARDEDVPTILSEMLDAAAPLINAARNEDAGKFNFDHASAEWTVAATILSSKANPYNLSEIDVISATIAATCGPQSGERRRQLELLPIAELRFFVRDDSEMCALFE